MLKRDGNQVTPNQIELAIVYNLGRGDCGRLADIVPWRRSGSLQRGEVHLLMRNFGCSSSADNSDAVIAFCREQLGGRQFTEEEGRRFLHCFQPHHLPGAYHFVQTFMYDVTDGETILAEWMMEHFQSHYPDVIAEVCRVQDAECDDPALIVATFIAGGKS